MYVWPYISILLLREMDETEISLLKNENNEIKSIKISDLITSK